LMTHYRPNVGGRLLRRKRMRKKRSKTLYWGISAIQSCHLEWARYAEFTRLFEARIFSSLSLPAELLESYSNDKTQPAHHRDDD